MTVRAALHGVTPPLLWQLGRRLRDRLRGTAGVDPAAEFVFAGEEWAVAETRFAPRGWQAEATREHYRRTWPAFAESIAGPGPLGVTPVRPYPSHEIANHNAFVSFAYAWCVATRGRTALSMLDWGCCFGQYYALARRALPEVAIEYHGKDMPHLAAAGRELFPDQTFHHDDRCLAREYDFVLASGSLHYMADWRHTLRALAAATSGRLLVTRLPTVTAAPSYVFLHRPGIFDTEFLGWCLNRDAFLAAAADAGLELEREFLLAERHAVAGASEAPQYLGFLFRPRGAGDG